MEFEEVKKQSEFNLKLTLEEAVNLWHLVNDAYNKGNKNAKHFIDGLHDFASRSNSYNEYI